MSDYVLVDGDKAQFLPAFGNAIVKVQEGRLRGSGPLKLGGKKACVSGDESSVSVPGCSYAAPPFVSPGTGTLEISALGGDQLAPTSKSGDVKLMVKGSIFTASFSVNSPAMQPSPSGAVPDPTPKYSGSGSFATANSKMKAG